MRIKLPLLLLPFCFAANDGFTFRDGQRVAFVFLLLTFAGVLQSLWYYLQHRNVVTEAYLQAHTITTPMGDDHVRFSLTVAIASLACVFLLANNRKDYSNRTVSFLAICLGIFVIYLHILGARTGLICFYLIAVVTLVSRLARRRRLKYILLLAAILLLPAIAFMSLPTFKNRLLYLRYDLSLVQRDTYVQGSNDGNRIASIKGGWRIVRTHPLLGVGFGDIERQSKDYYHIKYPAMTEADQILPSSEWMMYGAGNGLPGLICFSLIMLVPYFLKDLRKNANWLALNLAVALSYLFDIGLEVQYGVFIHAFILLWWYKWLRSFKY